jgi:hypothetical protein
MSSVVISGDTSGAITLIVPTTAGTSTLTLPSGASGTIAAQGVSTNIVSGTSASASGTSVDFTGIPSWVRRVTVMFNNVSTNGGSPPQIQLGAGSVTTSGYLGSNTFLNASLVGGANFTSGFGLGVSGSFWSSSCVFQGSVSITLQTGNSWVATGSIGRSDAVGSYITNGLIALSGTLDRVRVTTVNGTDAFDAGSINILYE